MEAFDASVEARVDDDLFQMRKAIEVRRIDRVDLTLCLLEAGARAEPRDLLPVVAVPALVAPLLGGEGDGRPELDFRVDESKSFRQHSNDGVEHTVDPQLAAHGIVASSEQPLPHAMAQHDLARLADLRVQLRKDLATVRLRPQQAEERWGHLQARDTLDLAAALPADSDARGSIHRDLIERGGLCEAVVVVRHPIGSAHRAGARV